MTRAHLLLARCLQADGLDAEGLRQQLTRSGCPVGVITVEMLIAGRLVPGERLRRAIDAYVARGAVEHRRGWPAWSIPDRLWDAPVPDEAA